MSLALKSDTVEPRQSRTRPFNPDIDSSATDSSDDEIKEQKDEKIANRRNIEELPPPNFPSPPPVTLLPASVQTKTEYANSSNFGAPKDPVPGKEDGMVSIRAKQRKSLKERLKEKVKSTETPDYSIQETTQDGETVLLEPTGTGLLQPRESSSVLRKLNNVEEDPGIHSNCGDPTTTQLEKQDKKEASKNYSGLSLPTKSKYEDELKLLTWSASGIKSPPEETISSLEPMASVGLLSAPTPDVTQHIQSTGGSINIRERLKEKKASRLLPSEDCATPKDPLSNILQTSASPENLLESSLNTVDDYKNEKEEITENRNMGFKEKLRKRLASNNVGIAPKDNSYEGSSNSSYHQDLPKINGTIAAASRSTTEPISNTAEVKPKHLPLPTLKPDRQNAPLPKPYSVESDRHDGINYTGKVPGDNNSVISIPPQFGLPPRVNTTLEAPKCSDESLNEDARPKFEMYLKQQLQKVPLMYVHQNDWRKFSDPILHSFSVQESFPAQPLSENCDPKKIYNFLREFVLHMEQCFERIICFPGEEIYVECMKFMKYPALPPQLTSFLKQKLQDFADEYMYRNEKIKEKEEQGALNMVNLSRDIYSRKVELQLEKRHLDTRTLEALFDSCYIQIEKNFLAACDFKHKLWKDNYKSSLQEAISGEKDRLRKANEENRVFLRSCLEGINRDCQSLYRKTVTEWIKLEENLDMQVFNAIDKKAVAEVEAHFVTRTQSEVLGQHEGIIDEEKKNMLDIIAKLSNKYRREINEKTQKVLLPQPQKPTRNIALASLPDPKIVSGSPVTNLPGSKRSTELSYDLLQDFMVIHLGLKVFKVGGFPQGLTKHVPLLTEDIWKYLKKEGLAIKSKELPSHEDSFLGAFIGKSIDTVYEVSVRRRTELFRIEDFMAFFISRIRKTVDDSKKLSKQPTRCIICLPQCLNHLQRNAIKDGCSLGGFKTTEIISDTHAMALAHLRHNSLSFPSRIVVANFSDAPYDVAWFSLTNPGTITCEAISGNFFLSKPGWVSRFCRGIKNIFSSSDEMEESITQILSKDIPSEGNKVFVMCGGKSDVDKVLNKHYHYLKNMRKPVDTEYPLKGAAEVAHILNMIEGNPGSTIAGPMHTLVSLKENILSHEKRNATPSYNEPSGNPLSATAYQAKLQLLR